MDLGLKEVVHHSDKIRLTQDHKYYSENYLCGLKRYYPWIHRRGAVFRKFILPIGLPTHKSILLKSLMT
jgi:hypothetical protein